MWAVVVALVAALFPLLGWVVRSFNEWRYCYPYSTSKNGRKLPPGHMGLPIIGELLDFLWCFKFTAKPDDFIWKKKNKYGDTGIYRSHLFGSPCVITCSPEANRFVTGRTSGEGSFTAGWPSPQLIGTNSIGVVEGIQHKRIKRYLMEAIHSPRSLAGVFISIQPSFKEAFESWALKGKITAFDEINKVTFSNICNLLFSYQSPSMLEKMEQIYGGLLEGIKAQPINLPGTAYRHALKCRKKLEGIISSQIHERKTNKGNSKEDFLQRLMDSMDSNGDNLSETEILDNMVSLILGGYISTANATSWTLYYLAKYPNVLQKLKDELAFIRQMKGKDELLTYEDVKSMAYTSKVINEALRLANVSSFGFRTVEKEAEYNGYLIPKGWKIIIWLRTNHVDPQYFEEPLKFNPDRWDKYKGKPEGYQVFGYGQRQCPGDNLTRMELFMFLYQICIDYKWELENPNASVKYLPQGQLVDGLKIKFYRV